MAVVTWRWRSIRRHPFLYLCLLKTRYINTSVTQQLTYIESNTPEWKKVSSKELGIKMSSIPIHARVVLDALNYKGHEVYLFGGCVRDLILNRTPKDFHIITSAQLSEVEKLFSFREIVGYQFPKCRVLVNDTHVEVSSLSILAQNSRPNNLKPERPPDCNDRDYIRWMNCLCRDFTINGLMFDPCTRIVYDYTGGLEDVKKLKVRTILPANISFLKDPAQILRAIRIAARLGFDFDKITALSLLELSRSIDGLTRAKRFSELNYMMAFGSSEASMRLLWRFGLLETLLPIQATYLASQGFQRYDERTNMLLCLCSNLDKLVAPNQPCHSNLWVTILAFHDALVEQPRDPMVVTAFSLALTGGGTVSVAVDLARKIMVPHNTNFDEILEPVSFLSNNAVANDVYDLSEFIKVQVRKIMYSDRNRIGKARIKSTMEPGSNLGIFYNKSLRSVCEIVDFDGMHNRKSFAHKTGNKIDYQALAMGELEQVQRVFATIVLNTLYLTKLKF